MSDATPPAVSWPEWWATLGGRVDSLRSEDISRFAPPTDGSGRQSAVLITLADTAQGPAVLLIERAADLRAHGGQVAFPGGSLDPGETPRQAALREAVEEVGLDLASVRVLAQLPAVYIPVSGFVVTPVVAWWERPHPVDPVDAGEVARVVLVSLRELADPANRFRVRHPSGWLGAGFEAGGLFVWGFTAGLLDRLLALGGWASEWDETRLRDLPPRPGQPSLGV